MTLTAILRFLCTFIVVIVFASGVQDYVLAVGPVRIMPLHTPGMKGQYQVTGIGPRTFTTPDMTISRASKNQIIINYFLDGQWRKVRVPTAMWEDKVIWADPKKGVRFGEPAKHGSTDWINYDKLTFGGEKEKTTPAQASGSNDKTTPQKLQPLKTVQPTVKPALGISVGGLGYVVSGVGPEPVIAKQIKIIRKSNHTLAIRMLKGETDWQELQAPSLELDGKTMVPDSEKGVILRGNSGDKKYDAVILDQTESKTSASKSTITVTEETVGRIVAFTPPNVGEPMGKLTWETDNVLHYRSEHTSGHSHPTECKKDDGTKCDQKEVSERFTLKKHQRVDYRDLPSNLR